MQIIQRRPTMINQLAIGAQPPLTDAVVVSEIAPTTAVVKKLRRAQYFLEAQWYGNFPIAILHTEAKIDVEDTIHIFEHVSLLRPSAFDKLKDTGKDCILMNRLLYEINVKTPLQFEIINADEYRELHENRAFIAAIAR